MFGGQTPKSFRISSGAQMAGGWQPAGESHRFLLGEELGIIRFAKPTGLAFSEIIPAALEEFIPGTIARV